MGWVKAINDIAELFRMTVRGINKMKEGIENAKEFIERHPLQSAVIAVAIPSTIITSYHALKGMGEQAGKEITKKGVEKWDNLKDL